jgi:hypothetical protein
MCLHLSARVIPNTGYLDLIRLSVAVTATAAAATAARRKKGASFGNLAQFT